MNWGRDYYYHGARGWGEFFGAWIVLIVALVAATAGLGLLFKIMWKIFLFGWGLV